MQDKTEIEIVEEKACVYHHVAEAIAAKDFQRAITALSSFEKINREDQSNIDFLEDVEIVLIGLAEYYKSRSKNRFDRFNYLKRSIQGETRDYE